MSYYPPGAFDALVQREEQAEKHEMTFEQALKDRIEELRKGGEIRYSTMPMMRENTTTARELVHENLNDDLVKEAVHHWLKGDIETAMAIFDDACEKALNEAADFLATCDAEVGEW